MEKFGKSQSVTRVEDVRLLTGHGRYVDDIAPSGALHAYFLRSTVAHGQITAIDAADARHMPGVHMVVTATDLEAAGVKTDMAANLTTNRDGTKGAVTMRPLLAKDRVRLSLIHI